MHQQILDFWFNEVEHSKWFVKDFDFDQLIIDRFSELHRRAHHCELYTWRQTAKGRLAEIIILDQFSRNMFREDARAFASDSLALALAQEAISVQADKALSAIECSFLYMPFMHSESELIQQVSIELFKQNGIESNYDFAIKHKKIIDEFGRYPHRNKVLGRSSSDAEIEFLKQPGAGF